ncbi:MAG: hypothetical protein K2M89_04165, partial [Clostridiales bacterium]|nr:hypothetical protein [Clostridiales bacterium]
MEDKYCWHYNDEDFISFAEEYVENLKNSFNYKSYITPHDEMRELLGRVIEEFQYLEASIKSLIEIAVEKGIYKGKIKFNFDNYIAVSKIINQLKNVLISEPIAKQLLE